MIGIKSTTLLALLALAFPAAVSLRAEVRMRPGLWEDTTAVDGKPSGPSHNTCYTPAMVEVTNSPAKTLRETTEKRNTQGGCTIKDFKMSENAMSMTKVCGARTVVFSSTYGGDAYETVETVTEAGVSKVIRMKGRRIGDCK